MKVLKVLFVGVGEATLDVLKCLLNQNETIEAYLFDMHAVGPSNVDYPFNHGHLNQPMVRVVKDMILELFPQANIQTYEDNVMGPQYGVNFLRKFTIVVNALEGRAMRSFLSMACHTCHLPVLHHGSAIGTGYIEVEFQGECERIPWQPNITIPTVPSDCLEWAKKLCTTLFNVDDPEDSFEVSPVFSKNWAKDNEYNPEKLFRQLFYADVKELPTGDIQPTPLAWEAVAAQDTVCSHDLMSEVWNVATCTHVFAASVPRLVAFQTFNEDDVEEVEHTLLDFITSSANLRAQVFGISPISRKECEDFLNSLDSLDLLYKQIAHSTAQWIINFKKQPGADHLHCLNCYNMHCEVRPCPVVFCPQKCGMRFHRCKSRDHSLLCSKEIVRCLNSGYGCISTMERGRLSSHLPACPASVTVCKYISESPGPLGHPRHHCMKVFRRDMLSGHVEDQHNSIQNNTTMWLEQCPLTKEGADCLMYQKMYPDAPSARIVYLEELQMYAIGFDTGVGPEPCGHDWLSRLPTELQLYILGFLDPLSLNAMNQVSVIFKELIEANFWKKSGVITSSWKKMIGSGEQWVVEHNRLFPHNFCKIRRWGHHAYNPAANHLKACNAYERVHHSIPYDLSNRYPVPKMLKHLMVDTSDT